MSNPMSRSQHREPISTIPNSRLFILGGKGLSESDWRNTFDEYGTITHISMLKDTQTGEQKGMTYITFSKSSEAFLAQENLNGKNICDQTKELKILIASDKRQGYTKGEDEEEKFTRIFLKVKKDWGKSEIEEEFSQYGEIVNIYILTHSDSGQSKGLAFVRFKRTYSAALALEGCDSFHRAEYAEPNSKKRNNQSLPEFGRDDGKRGRFGDFGRGNDYDFNMQNPMMSTPVLPLVPDFGFGRSAAMPMQDTRSRHELMEGFAHGNQETCIEVMVPNALPQKHLIKLVDMIPGMEFCDLDRSTGIAFVRYATPDAAACAKEKISGFEYPLGSKLGARYSTKTRSSIIDSVPRGRNGLGDTGPNMSQGFEEELPDYKTLVQTLKQTTAALAAAGININAPSDRSSHTGPQRGSSGNFF